MNDLYLKVVLTIIAICLVAITVRPIIFPKPVIAYGKEVVDVNIVQIQGSRIGGFDGYALPVTIKK